MTAKEAQEQAELYKQAVLGTQTAVSKPKPSYQSDLSKLPEKHQPKRTPGYSPTGHGFLAGLAGDWPGAKLVKTEGGDAKYDLYNPLTSGPREHVFASPEEQLDYEAAHGTGELASVAGVIPAVIKGAGRRLLGSMANRELKSAKGQAAQAAEWMSPKVEATKTTALLGDEAAQLANQSGERVVKATQAVEDAAKFGNAAEPLVRAGSRSAAVRGGSSMLDSLLGGARDSVTAEDRNNPNLNRTDPVQPIMGELIPVEDEQVVAPVQTQPSLTREQMIDRLLAQNSGLTPYQPKEKRGIAKVLDRIARTVNPVDTEQWDQEAAMRDYERQAVERGYLDPRTSMLLKEQSADFAADRGVQAQQALERPDQEFGKRFAPAMDTSALEEMYRLPRGSINPEALRRMGAEKQMDPMTAFMMQWLSSQGMGGLGAPQGSNEPTLNIPPQR